MDGRPNSYDRALVRSFARKVLTRVREYESTSARIVLICLTLLILSGCATAFDAHGAFHIARRGESLERIAKGYGVSLQSLAELNNIQNPKDLHEGQKIYLPERSAQQRFKKLPLAEMIAKEMKKGKRHKKGKASAEEKEIRVEAGKFQWPINGYVMSPFGIRHGRRHDGVDIKATRGTPIKAAASGEVVFSGKMRGYGNLILIKHEDNYFTAYAHNSHNGVKVGQKIKQGEVIGKVGATGRATGPHLHFEIREGEKARNPLFFLPPVS